VHELGLTQEILEIVTQRAQERKVKRVVLEIGKLSCVLPDAVRFCFDLCASGTSAEGAELEIVQPPGTGRCRQCGSEFAIHEVLARCICGCSDVEWLSGEELRIKTMEIA
jgi:hydrogenase nickel incorporation protein HypA/HybF